MGSTESSKVDVNLDLGGNTLTFATGATADTNIFEDGRGCLTPGTLIAPFPASPFCPSEVSSKWIWIPLTWTVSSCQYGAVKWTTGIPFSSASSKAWRKLAALWPVTVSLTPHSQSATKPLSLVYPVVFLSLTYSV